MDVEPVVTLSNGSVVLRAAYDLVIALIRDGYQLSVDADGTIDVTPGDLHPDVEYTLELNVDDVAAVLAVTGTTVH